MRTVSPSPRRWLGCVAPRPDCRCTAHARSPEARGRRRVMWHRPWRRPTAGRWQDRSRTEQMLRWSRTRQDGQVWRQGAQNRSSGKRGGAARRFLEAEAGDAAVTPSGCASWRGSGWEGAGKPENRCSPSPVSPGPVAEAAAPGRNLLPPPPAPPLFSPRPLHACPPRFSLPAPSGTCTGAPPPVRAGGAHGDGFAFGPRSARTCRASLGPSPRPRARFLQAHRTVLSPPRRVAPWPAEVADAMEFVNPALSPTSDSWCRARASVRSLTGLCLRPQPGPRSAPR